MGVGDGGGIRSREQCGAVYRQIRRGVCIIAVGTAVAGRKVHDPDVRLGKFVLAPAARRDRQPVVVEPDRQVPLAGPDEAPCTEASTGRNDLARRSSFVHSERVGQSEGAPPPVPSAGARTTAARSQPRFPGPADVTGRVGAWRRGQLHGVAAARPGADRLGFHDGRGRRALDVAGFLLRDDRRRPRRSQ